MRDRRAGLGFENREWSERAKRDAGTYEGLLLMELVFRLPQGLATSCPRALRPGTITPAHKTPRRERILAVIEGFSRSSKGLIN